MSDPLLFVDSFDHTDDDSFDGKWNDHSGTFTPVAGRTNNCMQLSTLGMSNPEVTVGTHATLTCGFAFQTSDLGNDNMVYLRDVVTGNGAQLDLLVDGRMRVTMLRAFTPSETPTDFALQALKWFFIEFSVTAGTTTVDWEIRVNEQSVQSGTHDFGASAIAAGISNLYMIGPNAPRTQLIDDLYITDGEFLGDVKWGVIRPNADGTHGDWTPSTGVTHWDLLNDTTPVTTTYISTATATDVDTEQMEDIVATGTIKGAHFLIYAEKDDAGAALIRPVYRNAGGTEVNGAEWAPSFNSWRFMREGKRYSVFTGVPWTDTEINGMEFGAERTA